MHLCQVLHCPPGPVFSLPAIVPNITRLGNLSLVCSATPPAKKSGRLRIVVSMLSQCHLEGLRVREGGMVSTMWALLEANDSQQDLSVSRSKLGKVFRSEGPRHTPVQQGLKYLGL